MGEVEVFTNRNTFLGFIITPEGILANPDKVEAIMRFPEPENIKQLQSFLGLCNFYRKLQKNYAQTTARLSAVPVSYTHLYRHHHEQRHHIRAEIIKYTLQQLSFQL